MRRIGMTPKVFVASASAVGVAFACKDPTTKIEKVSWINNWAKENGNCRIHMVLSARKKESYEAGNEIWDEKDHIDSTISSLKQGSSTFDENRKSCKEMSGKILRLARGADGYWKEDKVKRIFWENIDKNQEIKEIQSVSA